MKTLVQIIYWRDIPTHVRVRRGRQRVSHPLPERFQKTVYRAAYRGKAITGQAFEEAWHAEDRVEYEGEETDLQQIAAALAADLEAAYGQERLNDLALNKGRTP
jgi:hypothetical protein